MSHRAGQDVSAPVLKAVTGWIARHRLDLRLLARDAGVSIATAFCYLHEALDVIAAQAPELDDVLARAHADDLPFLCLDDTLVPAGRVAARAEAGHNLWYSGKHHAFGGNVQVLCDPTGFPLWVSDVRPGCTHELTAAREQVLPALYPHAAHGLPVLADKGYAGAGAGIHTPTKGRGLHPDNATRNELISCLRAPAERGNALLKMRWKALQRIRLCPWRIGAIVKAALVLTTAERPIR
jgi:hypothetical protein